MENKHTGFIMIGISALMVVVIFLFRNAIKKIVIETCLGDHGLNCPMYDAINQQTYLALAIVGIIVIMGLAISFSKPNERIIIQKVKEKKRKKRADLSDLRKGDRDLFKIIQKHGTIFQGELIEKTGFSKAKMTRILDKLDGYGLIERKRRGLTNVVVLKE